MGSSLRGLRITAGVELVTLIVLLANLATVHWPAVSSMVGPTHGCAYLFVIIAATRAAGGTRQSRLIALIPGIGGLLALRQLAPRRRDDGRSARRYTERLVQPDKGVNGFDSGR